MNKSISIFLAELRAKKGLTQAELGKALGMSRSKVSSWEIGRRDLSISDAVIIANYFDISLDHILNPKGITSGKINDIFSLYLKSSKIPVEEKENVIQEIQERILSKS